MAELLIDEKQMKKGPPRPRMMSQNSNRGGRLDREAEVD